MFNHHETRVKEAIRAAGPLEAYRALMAENDRLASGADLECGLDLAARRTAIHTVIVAHWAAEQQERHRYDRPFAVAALGGTGRGEMTRFSDMDFVFLVDDAVDGNSFILELQRQVVHTDAFKREHGFSFSPLPFNLDDVPNLDNIQTNSFMDMVPVHDPSGLTPRFRERIRATFDLFKHFLHVRSAWEEHWKAAAAVSERLDRFDIKNEGLRLFLGGVWALAGKEYVHSHEIYQRLEDPRDLEAYGFLLRIRAWAHSRRKPNGVQLGNGNHLEDILNFDDFTSFGNMLGQNAGERERFEFGDMVRSRIVSARRRVGAFGQVVMEQALKEGRATRPGSAIVYGPGGLYHSRPEKQQTVEEKSRAALSLLLVAQHYGVPIDRTELRGTFFNAGDWLMRVPELGQIFSETEGSLADSFDFLSQIDGATDRLFPGYARFESSLDHRVLTERKHLRGVTERQKLRDLERLVAEGREILKNAISKTRRRDEGPGFSPAVEAALLSVEHLAAVKLALRTKRLPVTADDEAARKDDSLPLHERFASGVSGIPVSEYYHKLFAGCDFTAETLRTAEFMVANRRYFKQQASIGINDPERVARMASLCQNEDRLRALYVFTCADRAAWESEEEDPSRWFNTRELYSKAMQFYRPEPDAGGSLRESGYSREEFAILQDFGVDFFTGLYRQYTNHFGSHLVRMAEKGESVGPKATMVRNGAATILAIAAHDRPGLAASIAGALWREGIGLRQAHLFSAANHRLALDFFHVKATSSLPPDLAQRVEKAVRQQLYVEESDQAAVPALPGTVSLQEWRPGRYRLLFEADHDAEGIVYGLAYRVYRILGGNIFGLIAHNTRRSVYVSVYHGLPNGMTLETARALVAEKF